MQPDGRLIRRELRRLLELFESLSHVALLDQQRPQRVEDRWIPRSERRRFLGIR